MIAGVAGPAPAWADATLTAFARARAAEGDGAVVVAARGYGEALDAEPGNAVIAGRAYREALDAGDYILAFRAAQALQAAGAAPADAGLLFAAEGMRKHDAAQLRIGTALMAKGPFAVLVPSVEAWAALDAGRDPFAVLARAKGNPLADRYGVQTRALLLIAAGRTAEGMAAVQTALRADAGEPDLRQAAAQLLAGRGEMDLARTLLDGDDPVVERLRESLADGGVRASGSFGLSRLFTRLAADIAGGNTGPFAVALTRAALLAEPANDRARILLAQALAKEDVTDQALAVLAEVPASSPFRALAEEAQIAVLRHAGERARALVWAKSRAEGKGAPADDLARYGDLLVEAGRFDEAAKAYRAAIKRSPADGGWTRWLQLGGALEQGGDWKRGEEALLHALALAPQEPVVLNYLGYARLEHGGDPAAALAMLEQASRLRPGDPSITDSLAWAYYRRGDAARAVPLLEQAARGEPENATIAEHLGDAYWSLGRRFEARYAWRAARSVAEAPDLQRLADKIADGLPKSRRR
ncbi:tetratricopeptide repeat protein [Sphingomonas aracearum]|uniref:Tetratricopeptide repeat protein n=1 Tax=Sphingomonas aracearum TaxID=2283317 RepID=A0A369VZW3_9SPHN|nr:tetratricopeptide repeat protein [Sphingomonas aracearum]RDE06602.1 tetratricopeptide repeat protein [Sphingomonas aracearum]